MHYLRVRRMLTFAMLWVLQLIDAHKVLSPRALSDLGLCPYLAKRTSRKECAAHTNAVQSADQKVGVSGKEKSENIWNLLIGVCLAERRSTVDKPSGMDNERKPNRRCSLQRCLT